MISIQKTVLFSLLLHAGALALVRNIADRVPISPPVIIDLSLSVPAGGGRGASGGGSAPKGVHPSSPSPAGKASMVQARPPAESARKPHSLERTTASVPVRETVVPKSVPLNPVAAPVPEHHQTTGAVVAQGASAVKTSGTTASGSGNQGGTGRGAAGSGTGTGAGTGSGSGSGSGSGTGNGSGSGSGNGLERQRERYLAEQFAYIRDIIQKHQIYPNRAKRDGLTGKVRVAFVIQENGTVADIRVVGSSGYEILDANAIETVKRSAPFPKPPVKAELRMPITYRLE
ncbi:MAG: energy transducer TonB [Desulfuromonadales bacterium]|nr:energy transducer TonB [Desulfuromonadales bacterium]